MNYAEFLQAKSHIGSRDGFAPVWMPLASRVRRKTGCAPAKVFDISRRKP